MFSVINELDTYMLSVPLFIYLMIAGKRVGILVFCEDRRHLLGRVRRLRRALGYAGVLGFLRIIVFATIWIDNGWLLVRDKILFILPLIVLPAAAVGLFAVPRLAAVAGRMSAQADAPLTVEDRRDAADPRLTFPVQLAAVCGALGLYLSLAPPHAPFWKDGVSVSIILAVSGGWLWLKCRMRHVRLGQIPADQAILRPRLALRMLRGAAVMLAFGAVAAAVLWNEWRASLLPDRMNMLGHAVDYGGGVIFAHGTAGDHADHLCGDMDDDAGSISVTQLTGPRDGEPDRRFVLTARKATVRLESGVEVEAWTFNGRIPGPELRILQGELVEVVLINQDIEKGVTIHWHGLNVPNAEDGVAGMTQDAVMPGETYTYRFRAEQTGTYWYHSHQQSSVQVAKGLFGPLIIERQSPPSDEDVDIPVVYHEWETAEGTVPAIGRSHGFAKWKAAPGTTVRLRLINADNSLQQFHLSGAPFRVAAIDGNDVHQPEDLTNTRLKLGGGGRYDLVFTMPDHPVVLQVGNSAKRRLGIVLSEDGLAEVPPNATVGGPFFDPAAYGSPLPTPFDRNSRFDREFVIDMHNSIGFYDGRFGLLLATNGEVYPNIPTLMVRQGELIKTTFINRTAIDHPMHLHGHHMLVLTRNGKPVTGSPWWTDALDVEPGEVYEVAFQANNPGLWMDHCHNLLHAAAGMTLHLAYEGVTTPFEVGRATTNHPE